jgi:hypothetical protein
MTPVPLGPLELLTSTICSVMRNGLYSEASDVWPTRPSRPNIDAWYEEGTFPAERALTFDKLGPLGMHLQGYGCAEMSAVEYGLACMELEAGDSGARSFASVQPGSTAEVFAVDPG